MNTLQGKIGEITIQETKNGSLINKKLRFEFVKFTTYSNWLHGINEASVNILKNINHFRQAEDDKNQIVHVTATKAMPSTIAYGIGSSSNVQLIVLKNVDKTEWNELLHILASSMKVLSDTSTFKTTTIDMSRFNVSHNTKKTKDVVELPTVKLPLESSTNSSVNTRIDRKRSDMASPIVQIDSQTLNDLQLCKLFFDAGCATTIRHAEIVLNAPDVKMVSLMVDHGGESRCYNGSFYKYDNGLASIPNQAPKTEEMIAHLYKTYASLSKYAVAVANSNIIMEDSDMSDPMILTESEQPIPHDLCATLNDPGEQKLLCPQNDDRLTTLISWFKNQGCDNIDDSDWAQLEEHGLTRDSYQYLKSSNCRLSKEDNEVSIPSDSLSNISVKSDKSLGWSPDSIKAVIDDFVIPKDLNQNEQFTYKMLACWLKIIFSKQDGSAKQLLVVFEPNKVTGERYQPDSSSIQIFKNETLTRWVESINAISETDGAGWLLFIKKVFSLIFKNFPSITVDISHSHVNTIVLNF